LDSNGVNPVVSVYVCGSNDFSINVLVEIQARIGALVYQVAEFETPIPISEEVVLPIDFRPVFFLHPKQLNYATTISGSVSIVHEDGSIGRSQLLEPRYLAVRDQGLPHEVFDATILETEYPYGITTENERQLVQNIIDSLLPEEGLLEWVGSGVYNTKPLSESLNALQKED